MHAWLQLLRVELEKEGVDQDVDSLIHIIMRNKYKNENKRQKLLVALLTYSSVDVNARAPNGMTALHRAAEVSFQVLSYSHCLILIVVPQQD